jgi:DNA-binding SARP family transcriptional activator
MIGYDCLGTAPKTVRKLFGNNFGADWGGKMKIIYRIRLLGSIQIEKEGVPIRDFESRKTLALLGYLARQEQPTSRSHLAGLLWGDKTEATGRRNLSRELSQLSSHLPNCFQSDYHTIQFQPVDCWVDTLAFQELVKPEVGPRLETEPVGATSAGQSPLSMADPADTPAVSNTQISNLAEAVALYQGDFMTGFNLDDCPDFETWLVREQETWRRQVTGILDCLTVYHGLRHQYNEAQSYVKRWLELEPWQEEAHRYMMILLARMGKRGDALVQYETCRRVLAEELDVEPEAETTALYEQIRTGKWEGERAAAISTLLADARASLPDLPPCPYRGLFAFREEDAPFFFGREAFTTRLVEAVHRQPLTVVIGPSGSGKTSIVFAGLLPHLRHCEGGWLIAAFRPGSCPVLRFGQRANSLLEPGLKETDRLVETGKLADMRLMRGNFLWPRWQPEFWRKIRGLTGCCCWSTRLKSFMPCARRQRLRRRFLDTLLEISASPAQMPSGTPVPLHLVLTLRTDFLGQVLAYRPFVDALVPGSDVKLGPMTRQELAQAIEKPAEEAGRRL